MEKSSVMFWAIPLWLMTFHLYCITESVSKGKLFFLQSEIKDNVFSKLLIVTWLESEAPRGKFGRCEVFTEQYLIEKVLDSAGNPHIQNITKDEIPEVLENCPKTSVRKRRGAKNEDRLPTTIRKPKYDDAVKNTIPRGRELDISGSDEKTIFDDIVSFKSTRKQRYEEATAEYKTGTTTDGDIETTTTGYSGMIFPGTKWCGAGDRARSFDDLGHSSGADECCRAHDFCDDQIVPGDTKYNLTNESRFTKLNCRCEEEFYDCLEKVNSVISNTVRHAYFNIFRPQCFTFDYPLGNCEQYRSFLKITCKKFEKDTNAPKKWQWVKARLY